MPMRMPFTGSCAETRELLSDYVEGELAEPLRRRVRRHLRVCRRCRAVWQALLTTTGALRTLGAAEAAPQPAIAESVVARIRAEQGDGSPSPPR